MCRPDRAAADVLDHDRAERIRVAVLQDPLAPADLLVERGVTVMGRPPPEHALWNRNRLGKLVVGFVRLGKAVHVIGESRNRVGAPGNAVCPTLGADGDGGSCGQGSGYAAPGSVHAIHRIGYADGYARRGRRGTLVCHRAREDPAGVGKRGDDDVGESRTCIVDRYAHSCAGRRVSRCISSDCRERVGAVGGGGAVPDDRVGKDGVFSAEVGGAVELELHPCHSYVIGGGRRNRDRCTRDGGAAGRGSDRNRRRGRIRGWIVDRYTHSCACRRVPRCISSDCRERVWAVGRGHAVPGDRVGRGGVFGAEVGGTVELELHPCHSHVIGGGQIGRASCRERGRGAGGGGRGRGGGWGG